MFKIYKLINPKYSSMRNTLFYSNKHLNQLKLIVILVFLISEGCSVTTKRNQLALESFDHNITTDSILLVLKEREIDYISYRHSDYKVAYIIYTDTFTRSYILMEEDGSLRNISEFDTFTLIQRITNSEILVNLLRKESFPDTDSLTLMIDILCDLNEVKPDWQSNEDVSTPYITLVIGVLNQFCTRSVDINSLTEINDRYMIINNIEEFLLYSLHTKWVR